MTTDTDTDTEETRLATLTEEFLKAILEQPANRERVMDLLLDSDLGPFGLGLAHARRVSCMIALYTAELVQIRLEREHLDFDPLRISSPGISNEVKYSAQLRAMRMGQIADKCGDGVELADAASGFPLIGVLIATQLDLYRALFYVPGHAKAAS